MGGLFVGLFYALLFIGFLTICTIISGANNDKEQ